VATGPERVLQLRKDNNKKKKNNFIKEWQQDLKEFFSLGKTTKKKSIAGSDSTLGEGKNGMPEVHENGDDTQRKKITEAPKPARKSAPTKEKSNDYEDVCPTDLDQNIVNPVQPCASNDKDNEHGSSGEVPASELMDTNVDMESKPSESKSRSKKNRKSRRKTNSESTPVEIRKFETAEHSSQEKSEQSYQQSIYTEEVQEHKREGSILSSGKPKVVVPSPKGIPRPRPLKKSNRDSMLSSDSIEDLSKSPAGPVTETVEFQHAVDTFDQLYKHQETEEAIRTAELKETSEEHNWKQLKRGPSFEVTENNSSQTESIEERKESVSERIESVSQMKEVSLEQKESHSEFKECTSSNKSFDLDTKVNISDINEGVSEYIENASENVSISESSFSTVIENKSHTKKSLSEKIESSMAEKKISEAKEVSVKTIDNDSEQNESHIRIEKQIANVSEIEKEYQDSKLVQVLKEFQANERVDVMYVDDEEDEAANTIQVEKHCLSLHDGELVEEISTVQEWKTTEAIDPESLRNVDGQSRQRKGSKGMHERKDRNSRRNTSKCKSSEENRSSFDENEHTSEDVQVGPSTDLSSRLEETTQRMRKVSQVLGGNEEVMLEEAGPQVSTNPLSRTTKVIVKGDGNFPLDNMIEQMVIQSKNTNSHTNKT